jgi:uncharacterized membrane protein
MAQTLKHQKNTATGNASNRIVALDFTKGALVLFMVLYHWLNYFHGLHGSIYRYLRFLPSSFIFITGFLISNAYLAKYDLGDPRLPKRLFLRGLKILGLFILLNLIGGFLLTGFENFNIDTIVAVFGTGNVLVVGVGKAAAFYILVPISYLLLLSAILLIICRIYKYTFYVVCSLFLLSIFGLDLIGFNSANLEFVTIGLIGLILGYTPIQKINAFVRYPYLVAAAYVCYTIAITFREPNYPLQIAGVCLTLMLVYQLGTITAETSGVGKLIVLVGKYSLFAYIAQVTILRLLRSALGYTDLSVGLLVLSFVVALALTILAVVVVDRARSISAMVDRVYREVFA